MPVGPLWAPLGHRAFVLSEPNPLQTDTEHHSQRYRVFCHSYPEEDSCHPCNMFDQWPILRM